MFKNKTKKFISAVLGIMLIAYVGYQIYLTSKSSLSTEMATYATVSDNIETRGFAVRDEVVIDRSFNGVLDYSINDGDRISNGDIIANVYQNSNGASVQNQIRRLTRQLEMLESVSAMGENYVFEPDLVYDEIYTSLNSISTDVMQFDFTDLQQSCDNFQMAVNRKNLITEQESLSDYQPRITELKHQIDYLESTAVSADDVITSPEAGYFISLVDGYEGIIDPKDVNDLTANQVKELLDTENFVKNDDYIGKVCHSFSWNIVCVLTEDEAVSLEGQNQVYLEIPFATTQQIPARISARNTDPVTREVAVIFTCLNMNSDIAKIRNEPIQIVTQKYSGVLVNENSIYFEDVAYEVTDEEGLLSTEVKEKVKGVYILSGDMVEFVQIFSDKTVNGYAICKTELSEEERDALYTQNTISLYDKVVSRTSDLYDGKSV